jgi:hypothetical protein
MRKACPADGLHGCGRRGSGCLESLRRDALEMSHELGAIEFTPREESLQNRTSGLAIVVCSRHVRGCRGLSCCSCPNDSFAHETEVPRVKEAPDCRPFLRPRARRGRGNGTANQGLGALGRDWHVRCSRAARSMPRIHSDPCLSEEQVLAFSEGRLRPGALDSLHAHLDWCSTCQELVTAAVHHWNPGGSGISTERIWMATFAPDQVLAGRYRIERFLERGGMGEVYAAIDGVLGERVALKTLLSTTSDDPRAVRRLLSEARLARRISHPNVCRVHDVGVHEEPGRVDEKLHFLIMEFIDGRPLGQVLRAGPLDLGSALAAARQVLAGLQAAHAAGVLHRDLKSDNIMVVAGGASDRFAIMDFGLSEPLGASAPAASKRGTERVGSLAYMAPEQIRGGELGPATDVFGFGVVLFEMLCGGLPFSIAGRTPNEIAERRLGSRAPAPSGIAAHVPPAIDELVLRCLELDPKLRFASAAQVLGALEAAYR